MTYTVQKKSLFLLLLLMLSPLFCGAADSEAEFFIHPETVHPGEAAFLVIRTEGKKPDTKKLPAVKDLRWISSSVRTSSSVSIVNGKMTSRYENHIPFVVSKKGRYVIPLEGILNGFTSSRKEISFEAEERVLRSASEREKASSASSGSSGGKTPESVTLENAIFSDMIIPGKARKYYAGEEIPLEVNLYILQNLNGRPVAYPQIAFGENNGAIFRDYRKVNPENPNFERVSRSRRKIGKFTYTVLTFHTRFTPISPGTMQIRSQLPAMLLIPDDRRNARSSSFFDDDDFFGSFFDRNRRIERNLPATVRVDILKQPPVPQNAFFTGLTGSWKGEVILSPPPYKAGEPINLRIRYTGRGSLDFFKAPTLSLNGFRCYPPEVEKGGDFAEIRYVIIPVTQSDGKEENFRLPPLAVLDPATGKYNILEFSKKIAVEKGTHLLADDRKNAVVDGKRPSSSGEEKGISGEEETRQHADDVLYLKDLSKDDPITLPLWKNRIISCMILILAGLLVLTVSSSIAILKRRRENDPLFARRKEANALRKTLVQKLEKLPAEELCTYSGRIAEVLAGLTGLPPGADLKECASFIEEEDDEFAEQLEKIASAAWMPSAKASLDEKFRKSFLKRFSSFTMLLIFACILFLVPDLAGEEKKQLSISSATTPGEAAKAYDAGKFTVAEEYYRKELKKGHYSANILYNLGNTLYRKGELADALVCYEQALLLAPHDSDIMENLNLVRRKLALPEKGRIDSPAEILPVLRDHLRPDGWIFAAAAGFFFICLGLTFRILAGKDNLFFRVFSSGGTIILLISLCAFFSQQKSSYSRKRVIVTEENVKAYSLPSENSAPLSLKFRSGEELSSEEKREHFIRVRSGNAEGWIPVKSVKFLQVDVNKRK